MHKRLKEKGTLSAKDSQIHAALQSIKLSADENVLQNTRVLDNESYFEQMMLKMVVDKLVIEQKMKMTTDNIKYVNRLIVTEYMNQLNGVVA